jgi:hypothetical protein
MDWLLKVLIVPLLYYYAFMLGILLLSMAKSIMFSLRKRDRLRTKKLMIVFGSGGHTTEMLLMLTKDNQFDFSKYKEVQFVIGQSDTWSLTKIKDFLGRGNINLEYGVPNVRLIKLFRSREVK